ncbi:hypothetical protein ACNOYE_07350 [Nannocystaceae bacterium ST9]
MSPASQKGADQIPAEVREYYSQVFALSNADEPLGTDWLASAVSAMRDVSSLRVIRTLLKAKALTSSANSWDILLEQRIRPAIDAHQLSRADIESMLEEAEEHSTQHVLFYRLKSGFKIESYLNPDKVQQRLKAQQLLKIWCAPTPFDTPRGKKILTHVRFDSEGCLIAKSQETREVIQQFKVQEYGVGRICFERVTRQRRVRLAKLHPDGLFEIRLGSIHAQGKPHNYQTEAGHFMDAIKWLIPSTHFAEVRFDRLRRAIWDSASRSVGRIHVLSQDMASSSGSRVAVHSKNRTSSVSNDNACKDGVTAFMNHDGSLLDRCEVQWVEQPLGQMPSANVSIRLSGALTGASNEISFTQHNTKQDSEYVVSEIRRFGRF